MSGCTSVALYVPSARGRSVTKKHSSSGSRESCEVLMKVLRAAVFMTLINRVTYVSPLAAVNSCISQRTLLSVYSIITNVFDQ